MLIGIDGDAYEIDEVNGVQKLVEDVESGRQFFAIVVPVDNPEGLPANDVTESAASADWFVAPCRCVGPGKAVEVFNVSSPEILCRIKEFLRFISCLI